MKLMRASLISRKVCFNLFLAIMFLSTTFLYAAEDPTQIIIRTEKNYTPNQYESYVTMKNYKPGKETIINRMHLYRKADKFIAIYLTPVSQKGQAFIRNGDNMWMYLPKSEKLLRIGAKDNSSGGEASNTDLMRLDFSKDYDATYISDETIDNYNCYKLELKARMRTVAYDRVIYWISRDKELPIRREYYAISGKLLKTFYFDNFKVVGGQEVPTMCTIVNGTNKDYKSEFILEDRNVNVNFDDTMFNPSYIKRLQ